MFITASTVDDLLHEVFEKLIQKGKVINPTRGEALELIGVLLELKNPRARVSRTETRGRMFSSLGELLWYLSKTNDLAFICYYLKDYETDSEDGQTIYGGYGPRLFRKNGKIDQVKNILKLLKERPNSRRAVIQLFDAEDIVKDRKEIPCTCTMQFLIRRGKLDMFTCMRSNDAFLGLSHDIFAFTMLQEIMARSLNVKLGRYKHAVGSLHLYKDREKAAKQYLDEGWQSKVPMPSMPKGDPWPSIKVLLDAESDIRNDRETKISTLNLSPYWADLLRLLQIYARYSAGRAKDKASIERLKQEMSSDVYMTYIERR